MIWILFTLLFLGLCFCVLYPAFEIMAYKAKHGKKISVKEILEEIGW